MKITNLLSTREIEALPPRPRAGSDVPTFAESVVHKAADDALDTIQKVLGFSPASRDAWLQGPDGRLLRNVLRRFIMHGNASSMEPDK